MRKILLLLSILMLASLASATCTQPTFNMADYPAQGTRAAIFGTVPPSCIGGAYISNITVTLYNRLAIDEEFVVLRLGPCGSGTIMWQTALGVNPNTGNVTDRQIEQWVPYVNPVIGKTITNSIFGIPAGSEFCIEFTGVQSGSNETVLVSTVLVP
jgi:hypothetical protein